jgi:pyridoxamine 5'-phosphate oxidase-like protein
MSAEEAGSYLAEQRIATCATLGPRGWPHLMPLWYVLRAGPLTPATPSSERPEVKQPDHRIWAWTYAASQKVRNLERDARATLQIETGEEYQELRGVMLECEVLVHRDLQAVAALGREIFMRYSAPAEEPGAGAPAEHHLSVEIAEVVEKQAAKRVALEFVELRRASWDHRKLGGVY